MASCISGLADEPRARPRERERAPAHRAFYLDADRDGFGAGASRRFAKPPDASWVRNNTDCDDTNPRVHQNRRELLLDCDTDSLADALDLRTVCVGRKTLVYWHDEKGFLRATMRYPDSYGFWWIDAMSARRTPTGEIAPDPSPGCTTK